MYSTYSCRLTLKSIPCCLHKLSFSLWGTLRSARLICFLFCFGAISTLHARSKENFPPQFGKWCFREASRSCYNPKPASKSHLPPPELLLFWVASRFCLHLQSTHFTVPAILLHKDCDHPFHWVVDLSKQEAFKTTLSNITCAIETRHVCRILKTGNKKHLSS